MMNARFVIILCEINTLKCRMKQCDIDENTINLGDDVRFACAQRIVILIRNNLHKI